MKKDKNKDLYIEPETNNTNDECCEGKGITPEMYQSYLDSTDCDYEDTNNNQEIILEPLTMDIDNLDNVAYDEKEFQKGVKEFSYLSGVITALKNVGLDNESIIAYLTTLEVLKSNINIAELSKTADVEISKNQKLMVEKNMI